MLESSLNPACLLTSKSTGLLATEVASLVHHFAIEQAD